MGLFQRKTDAEKALEAEIKEVKQDAREERKDARKDAREEKKEARKDARDEKKDAREEAREEKKDAREEKRDEMKDVRQSDLKGEEKRDAKSEVRDEKHDTIRDAKDDKRDTIDHAVDTKKDRIDEVQGEKKATLNAIRKEEIEALSAANAANAPMLDVKLALELLALTHVAQFSDAETLGAESEVKNTMLSDGSACLLDGAIVRDAVAIARKNFKSDTECFVARSDKNDVVVAFRGSETAFFDQEGAFRDWVLTDFRANRIAYPPAPKSWPDQRWVHAGFWQAYNLVRNELLEEVTRKVTKELVTFRIYVTGFSLGGALALLAALDIAEALPDEDVELFTFAAPRAGDESLNKLLAERVHSSTLIAFRGDPVVHLPPFGPNFPVTLKNPISLDLGGIHIGLGTPLPQVGQQYRTAADLFYIDKDGAVKRGFPPAQVALNFRDHNWDRYSAALSGIANPQAVAA